MRKVLIGGAGGAPSEGVIRSLNLLEKYHVIGLGSDPADIQLSQASERYLVPSSDNPSYKDVLLYRLRSLSPDFAHFQSDIEILRISSFRDQIEELGVKLFIPPHSVIETCTNKYETWQSFKRAGISVPENLLIRSKGDLRKAFKKLSDSSGRIWLRSNEVGGGGRGSLSVANLEFAHEWIVHNSGYGNFLAAEHLTKDTVTWLSIWKEGKLVIAQSRKRIGWIHGNRSPSGVTGVTHIGVTDNSSEVTEIAMRAILSVDTSPNGIYGVDMTYDANNIPNPTEINIGRFFTTVLFFTKAGVNFPEIYLSLGLGQYEGAYGIVNPLPINLAWIRGMDTEPTLVRIEDIDISNT